MKKLLSVLLASATAVTACAGLAACDGAENSKELVIWCPSAAMAVYTQLGEEFISTYNDGAYKDYTIKVIAHEEGNAETDLGVDLTQGADVYFTEGGQIERLIAKKYIQPLTGKYAKYAETVKADNTEAALPTITKGETVYAFPATADNTWFFWYDNTFFDEDDIVSFDKVFKKAQAANKHIAFAYDNGWYNTAWFMTAGCTMDYVVDSSGTKKYKIDVDSEKGLLAAQSLHTYVSKETGMFANGENPVIIGCDNSTIPNGAKDGSVVAGFQGSWISGDLPAKIVPAATAPKIKIGEEEKDMVNFFTYKYAGVNPARKNVDIAMELAAYITNEAGQAARFEATGSNPSNKKVAASDAVMESPIAQAIADRAAHGYSQLSQTADFWSSFETFGKNLRLDTGATTYAGLADALKLLQVGVLGDETPA